jgi:hypothetical protein
LFFRSIAKGGHSLLKQQVSNQNNHCKRDKQLTNSVNLCNVQGSGISVEKSGDNFKNITSDTNHHHQFNEQSSLTKTNEKSPDSTVKTDGTAGCSNLDKEQISWDQNEAEAMDMTSVCPENQFSSQTLADEELSCYGRPLSRIKKDCPKDRDNKVTTK